MAFPSLSFITEASWWQTDTEDMFTDHGKENSATHTQRPALGKKAGIRTNCFVKFVWNV